MPTEAKAIHATAIAIDGWALAIRGPSRSGKSTLALALLACSRPGRAIHLVGDDRVLLRHEGGAVLVSPHPRIAGLIERRGCGILSLPYRGDVPLAGLVDLAPAAACDAVAGNFPTLTLVDSGTWDSRAARVLGWAETLPAHSRVKTLGRSKD